MAKRIIMKETKEKYPKYVDGECKCGNSVIPTFYNHYKDGSLCGNLNNEEL